ncbi:hypothetical protein [Acetobacter senegalensis]|uniref:hypothetical protein n=1 Tax=Acetobacter senegalensis TaxID=446692 RepID=UPI0026554597|nr:hypothetical protein [Acetobacter senegalensis]MDN7355186.1 hypothetical protein [Acetobacter senegalensis]
MSKLISSGKDAEYEPNIEARIDWASVKGLFILDMQYAGKPEKWDFWPCVVFHDDTWLELSHDGDITEARQMCARLSALHDKPMRDWTRPAPSGLTLETPEGNLANYLQRIGPDGEETEPLWGAGWELTDHLFQSGATADDLLHHIERAERKAGACQGILRSEAVQRWLMLHAANAKPEPKPEGTA